MIRGSIPFLVVSCLLLYFIHTAAAVDTTAAPTTAAAAAAVTTAAPAASAVAAAVPAAAPAAAPAAGASDGLCPNITLKNLRIICEHDGKPAACNLIKVGGTAKVTWRKHALKNSNSGLEIECQPPGVWKIKARKDGTYKVHKEKKSWIDAEAICVKEAGHLVFIETEDEMKAIKALAATIGKVEGSINAMHIGLFDRNVEGMFETVLGAPFKGTTFFPWGKGKPRGKLGEDCGAMFLDNFDASDMGCREKLPFICETYTA